MSLNSVSPHPRIFYGWLVVAAAFAVTFVGFGSAYTFSAVIGSLQKDFVASRAAVSFVFSLAGFLYFGFGIVSGPLADRWGSRRLAVIGMLLTGIGLASASAARSLTEVYAAYGLGVGLGVGCSYVPAVGAVQRWFAKRRGFCVRSGRQWNRSWYADHASPRLAPYRGLGMARSLSRPRWSCRVRRRRNGSPDRERPKRSRTRPRR